MCSEGGGLCPRPVCTHWPPCSRVEFSQEADVQQCLDLDKSVFHQGRVDAYRCLWLPSTLPQAECCPRRLSAVHVGSSCSHSPGARAHVSGAAGHVLCQPGAPPCVLLVAQASLGCDRPQAPPFHGSSPRVCPFSCQDTGPWSSGLLTCLQVRPWSCSEAQSGCGWNQQATVFVFMPTCAESRAALAAHSLLALSSGSAQALPTPTPGLHGCLGALLPSRSLHAPQPSCTDLAFSGPKERSCSQGCWVRPALLSAH